jgi:hypothetical protein
MTARGIICGVLFKPPVSKLTKKGKPYLIATIRQGSGEAMRWWKAFAFSETAIDEISRLGDREPIAVAGQFDAEICAPDGAEPRLSWRITVDAVLTARPKPKRRRKCNDKPARTAKAIDDSPSRSDHPNHSGALNDDLPF